MWLTPEQTEAFGDDKLAITSINGAFALDKPERIGIAVSGGGDSMALLHLTWRWAVASGVPIEAVTVNHGLRQEAADEAEMVSGFCETFGIPHTTLNWDGSAAHGNVASEGRNARFRLIAQWAKERSIGGIFLGHNKDDIAETFLMRLARKAGVDGLSVMDSEFEREGMMWARPLCFLGRAELRDYLRHQKIDWVDDPTNEDMSYERPKARKALAALEPLGITVDTLAAVAVAQKEARLALEGYARGEAERVVSIDRGDVLIARRVYPPVDREINRRLTIESLRFVGGGAYPPRSDAMLELELGLARSGKKTLAGCVVTNEKQAVRIAREPAAVATQVCRVGDVWDKRWQVSGPASPDLHVQALGEWISEVPNWRNVGLPRSSLMASPAVFDGETLISAPVAGYNNGFDARIVTDFSSFLLSR